MTEPTPKHSVMESVKEFKQHQPIIFTLVIVAIIISIYLIYHAMRKDTAVGDGLATNHTTGNNMPQWASGSGHNAGLGPAVGQYRGNMHRGSLSSTDLGEIYDPYMTSMYETPGQVYTADAYRMASTDKMDTAAGYYDMARDMRVARDSCDNLFNPNAFREMGGLAALQAMPDQLTAAGTRVYN